MNEIAVDKPFLAECLGLEEWPADLPLDTQFEQMAARAITDAFRPIAAAGNPVTAKIAISNAESWITAAYSLGRFRGETDERARWEAKIRTMFGLQETR